MYIDHRHRLERLLGRGGMGEVWRAHDLRLGRPVAIKFLPPQQSGGGRALARFEREATVTAGLRHPGITEVFDYGVQDGQPYVVMELLDGRDLAAVLDEHESGLPVAQTLDIGAQVADALSYAHQAHIVHRDIKPANLMLLADGRIKVCDFGVAGLMHANSDLTREGSAVGTPAYMAPEQCDGQRVDGRADLYALGCVLFALLTGRPPFQSYGDYRAVMLHHIRTPPPLLASLRPGLPDGLQQLVSALLSKDPAARPTYAGVVADRLRELGRPRPGPTAPGTTASREPAVAYPPTVPDGTTVLAEHSATAAATPGSGIGVEVFQDQYLTPDATVAHAILTVLGAEADSHNLAAAAPRSLVFLVGLSDGLPEADFEAVRQCVVEAVDSLDEGVAFAVVAGSEYARMLYPDTMRLVRASAATKAEAQAALTGLAPVSAAAFGRWIRLADRLFAAHPDTVRTSILLTDLEATAETTEELAAALAASTGRFSCHARGIGVNWSVSQLRSVTTALSGTVDIVATPSTPTADGSLARELVSIIDRTRQAFARNLALRITMPAGVQVQSLKQTSPSVEELSGRAEPVGPGAFEYPVTVPGNTACDFHLSLAIPPGRAGDAFRAADLDVVLLPPAGDGQSLATASVKVVRGDDLSAPTRINPSVAHYTSQAELAQAITEGLAAFRRTEP
ncbi:protein kinase domain-containing protein [Kitasatospora sp. McL0602]|uniref:serine/threonine-protein kinase n=1 Tax=Kitasatospora sp. McL0602 TaxID=3439530 RepID=UPI003F8A9F9D